MNKTIIIAVAVALLSFVGGLIGMYYVMPAVAPDLVEEVQKADSLAQAEAEARSALTAIDSVASAGMVPEALDSAYVEIPWAIFGGSHLLDQDARQRIEEAILAERDSMRHPLIVHNAIIQRYEDSLRTTGQASDSLRLLGEELTQRTDSLDRALTEYTATRSQAVDFAGTLTKLEDGELREILSRIDMEVIEILYNESAGRSRVRLLQAMPADMAASFVNDQVAASSETGSSPAIN